MNRKSLMLISVLTTIAAFTIVQFSESPPPRSIQLVTGNEQGAYHTFGLQLAEQLRRSGLDVTVTPTAGALENRSLIESGNGNSIGFIQAGLVSQNDAPGLRGIAGVYYEPLWVFYRRERFLTPKTEQVAPTTPLPDDITALSNCRIAIGQPGSGTLVMAEQILRSAGISTDTAAESSTTVFLRIPASSAADQLQNADIDAAIFVAGTDSPLIERLLHDRNLELLSFRRDAAFVRELDFLHSLDIPAGLIDLAADVPPRQTTLLAPMACLAGHAQTHPAVTERVLLAAAEVCRRRPRLTDDTTFPTLPELGDIPNDPTAERVILSGASAMSQLLPYWMLNLIRQIRLLVISFIPALLFVTRGLPLLLDFRTARRVYGCYRRLYQLEHEQAREDREQAISELQQLRDDVARMSVPLRYQKDVYNLRLHILLVLSELRGTALVLNSDARDSEGSSSPLPD